MIKNSNMEFNPEWWKDVTFPTGLTKEQLTQPTWFHRLKSGQVIQTSRGEEYIYGQYVGSFDLPACSPISIYTEIVDEDTELYTFVPGSDHYYMGWLVMDVKPKQWCIAQRVMPTVVDVLISTTDYNKLSNKPTINGVKLEGNQDGTYYGVSNIYYLEDTLPLSELQTGYDMLGATIDFSGISAASFEGVTDQYGSIERADISSPPTNYWFLLCQTGKGQTKLTITVNASQVRQGGSTLNGQTVCTWDPAFGTLTWDPTFPVDKIWHFDSFADLPTHTSVVGAYRDDELATLWDDIKVTSGNERLAVDCEFLHGQLGQVTSAVGEIDGILTTKSDIYNTIVAGTLTAVDCQWLYNDSVTSKSYNVLIDKPSINNVTLEGNKTSKQLGLSESFPEITLDEIHSGVVGLPNEVYRITPYSDKMWPYAVYAQPFYTQAIVIREYGPASLFTYKVYNPEGGVSSLSYFYSDVINIRKEGFNTNSVNGICLKDINGSEPAWFSIDLNHKGLPVVDTSRLYSVPDWPFYFGGPGAYVYSGMGGGYSQLPISMSRICQVDPNTVIGDMFINSQLVYYLSPSYQANCIVTQVPGNVLAGSINRSITVTSNPFYILVQTY